MNCQDIGQDTVESNFNTVPRPRAFQVAGIDGLCLGLPCCCMDGRSDSYRKGRDIATEP